jgi:hypothetical protein
LDGAPSISNVSAVVFASIKLISLDVCLLNLVDFGAGFGRGIWTLCD